MKRRKFIQNSLLTEVATLGVGGIFMANPYSLENHKVRKSFNLDFAPHFGMFENHAGADLLDQIAFMADSGFKSLEDNGLMKRTPEIQEKRIFRHSWNGTWQRLSG